MTTLQFSRSAPSRHLWLIQALFALTAILATPSAHAEEAVDDSASAADLRLRRNGWTVDSITLQGAEIPGLRHLVASGRIAAPARDVWVSVAKPDEQGDGWPSLKDVIIEHSSTDTTIARYTMAVPVYPDRRYRLQSVADHKRMKLDFELIPGYGNVHEIRGYWKISALSDSLTHLVYVLDTDPGVRLIPGFIVDWATRNTIPRSFAYLRDRTLSQGKVAQRTGEGSQYGRRRKPRTQSPR
jgi:hypothetical protein